MPKKQQARRQDPEDNLGLPAALDVERAVLGMLFLNELAYEEAIAGGLRREDFAADQNRRVFRAVQQLVNDKRSPDLVLTVEELRRAGELDAVGGVAYVSSLIDGVPDRVATVKPYIEILKEKSMRRGVIHIANSAVAQAVSPADPVKWTVSSMQEDLLRLQGDITSEGVFIREFSAQVLADVQEEMYSDREVLGLSFGIPDLDEATTGIRAGEFVVLGGLPASGKTSFAVDLMRKIAKTGDAVAFFSVEMRKEQILHRLWSQESDLAYSALRNPKNLTRPEFRELEEKWRPLVDQYPIKIDDEVRDINEIIPRARLYKKRYGVKLFVVDFLQIVTGPGEKEYDRVSYVADALTALAKTTNVPVMALSQLTRPEDKKNAHNIPPNMTMLRSSGKIEQNAHLILMTHRPHGEDGEPNGEDLVIIAKQRAGVGGRIKAYFNARYQRWEDRVAKEPEPKQEKIFKNKKEKTDGEGN